MEEMFSARCKAGETALNEKNKNKKVTKGTKINKFDALVMYSFYLCYNFFVLKHLLINSGSAACNVCSK